MDRKNRRYVDGIKELHCHTKMSEGKGLIAPDELVRYAYENRYKAVRLAYYMVYYPDEYYETLSEVG